MSNSSALNQGVSATTELYLGDIERQKKIEAAPEKRLNEYLVSKGIG